MSQKAVTLRTLVIAAALVALLAAAPPADAAKRRVPQGFFGVMWDGSAVNASEDLQQSQWDLMARSGVEAVRAIFSWDRAQPTADAPLDFTRTDRLVTLALEHNMFLLPVVLDTPSWAAAYDHAWSPPRRASRFAEFMAALVDRYGPAGSFWNEHPLLPRRPIRYWQIWNEPELIYRWYAKDGSRYAWPGGYLAVLKAGYRAVKEMDPGAKVVLAGLTNDSWNSLRVVYRRRARRYFDVAAIQTYTGSPTTALKAIRLFRRVMRRYGDARKPIWATETSWPAAVGRMDVPTVQRSLVSTDRGMAARLKTMFTGVAKRRRLARYRVARIFWYTWSSPYRAVSDIFDFAGLRSYYRGRFRSKPALRAYRSTVRRFEGCPKDDFGNCAR